VSEFSGEWLHGLQKQSALPYGGNAHKSRNVEGHAPTERSGPAKATGSGDQRRLAVKLRN
jgi:hypothetical protein